MPYGQPQNSAPGTWTNYREVPTPSNTETYDDPFGEGYLLTPESQTETHDDLSGDMLDLTPERTTEVNKCHQQYQSNKKQRTKNMTYIERLLAGIKSPLGVIGVIAAIGVTAVAAFYMIQKSVTETESSLANGQKDFKEVAEKCNASDLADDVNEKFDKHKNKRTVLRMEVENGVANVIEDNFPEFKSSINEKEAALGQGLSELKKRVGWEGGLC